MLYYYYIVIEMYGILLDVFVDTFSNWRGYRATRMQKLVGFALLKLESTNLG